MTAWVAGSVGLMTAPASTDRVRNYQHLANSKTMFVHHEETMYVLGSQRYIASLETAQAGTCGKSDPET